jgi:hypothetical protein
MPHHRDHHRVIERAGCNNGVGAAAMPQGGFDRGEEVFDPGVQPIEIIEGVGDVKAAVGGEKGCCGGEIGRLASRKPRQPGIDHLLGRVAIHALIDHETHSFNPSIKGYFAFAVNQKTRTRAILPGWRSSAVKSSKFELKLMA